ncbi:MAG: two-component response regulator [Pseudobdellovibrio sp.]|jgi:hypothetical protein|nr:two-component response regulator [Pseudobdellovibrio sp.]
MALDDVKEKRISNLLNLVNVKRKSKLKVDILNNIETINGYDLVFILGLMMRDNFSGNLIIVNEENLLSGITFIYGDIVKVDYPDQEHLLGNLIIENEILSRFEMQEIMQKSAGKRLGDYLIENSYITEQQLRKLLFTQTSLRLTKYISSLSVRIKFTFDGQSNDSVLISKVDYTDILYKWIFNNFKDEWLEEFGDYYSKNYFSCDMGTNELQFLKDHPEVYNLAYKITQLKKASVSFAELFKVANLKRPVLLKIMHFLLLSGAIYVARSKEIDISHRLTEARNRELLQNLEKDLVQIQSNLLNKRYFEALGLLNKYSAFIKSHVTVCFYFIWIKLIGAYYNNHLIDVKKISQDLFDLDYFKINPAEFYYVRALLYAVERKYKESDESYKLAVSYNPVFKRYPINADEFSFLQRILNFFNSLGS